VVVGEGILSGSGPRRSTPDRQEHPLPAPSSCPVNPFHARRRATTAALDPAVPKGGRVGSCGSALFRPFYGV